MPKESRVTLPSPKQSLLSRIVKPKPKDEIEEEVIESKRERPPSVPPGARPRTRNDGGHEGEDAFKQKPYYSDEVQLRLINLIYDPLATKLFKEAGIDAEEAHLLSLSRINSSREAMYWAQQIAKEAAFNIYVKRHKCDWPITQVQRIAMLLARRSIPGSCGPGFMLGVGLAQEQNIVKAEEAAEENDW